MLISPLVQMKIKIDVCKNYQLLQCSLQEGSLDIAYFVFLYCKWKYV